MKNLILLCVILLFAFKDDSAHKILSSHEKQEIVSKTTCFKPSEILLDRISIHSNQKKITTPSNLFSILHSGQTYHYPSFILGYFKGPDNSMGILCYDEVHECDHPIDCYSLYMVDKKNQLSDQLIIKYEDNEVTIYEIDFKFLSNSHIELSQKTSSEHGIEPDNNDTITTETYLINFTKNPFDTIEKKQAREIIER